MAIKKLFKTAHELIEGYDLGGKKRGESNVWIEGRILKSGNVLGKLDDERLEVS